MSLWDSKIYMDNLQFALGEVNVDYFKNTSVLITGGTGLIGSSIVDLLIMANRLYDANITIYTAGRNKREDKARFPDGEKYGVVSVHYDATKPVSFDVEADYIIHCASNASPDKYIEEPVDTMLANVMGVHNLLSYAVNTKMKKFIYVSSSEVYGKQTHGQPMKETEYGVVDILSVRSSYSVGKQAAETMCVSYAKQYNTQVSIVRPGHIYGPTALPTDKRIASDFAYKAARGEKLVMKSAGTQIRSYCHCLDCATAMLKVLEKGENGSAYNISNPNSVITIRQMAEILSESTDVPLILDLPTDTEKAAFNPMDNSSLDSKKLEALGWNGIFDAQKGLSDTVAALKDIINI